MTGVCSIIATDYTAELVSMVLVAFDFAILLTAWRGGRFDTSVQSAVAIGCFLTGETCFYAPFLANNALCKHGEQIAKSCSDG